jgi:hypothetical protein
MFGASDQNFNNKSSDCLLNNNTNDEVYVCLSVCGLCACVCVCVCGSFCVCVCAPLQCSVGSINYPNGDNMMVSGHVRPGLTIQR